MGSRGRMPPPPHLRHPLPGPGIPHPDAFTPGMRPPPGAFPPFDMPPHPEILEQKVSSQHMEMQKLLTENQRLAGTQGTLRQELAAAQHEHSQIGAVKSERDHQVRGLVDKIARMEADLQAADSIKSELKKVRADAQSLVVARQELVSKVQRLTQDLQRAHGDAELNCEEIGDKKTNRSTKRKRRDQEKGSKVEASVIGETEGDNERGNLSRKRKANKIVTNKSGVYVADELANEVEGVENNGSQANRGKKTSKMRKERRKEKKKKKKKSAEENANEHHRKVNGSFIEENAKSKEAHKSKKKNRKSAMKDGKLLEEKRKPEQDEFYEISSGDEDSSRGMKKWIAEYYESRPGLKVLQDQIDDFITAHEEQEEQARKEMEAQAAEGGWTVVVHHKGRKKTTDAESGTAVGSVAPAAVMENMAKKKNKEVGVDFYRFQKREAQMNEIMALQSKFEQDKKRIQQLRAARKFRPY